MRLEDRSLLRSSSAYLPSQAALGRLGHVHSARCESSAQGPQAAFVKQFSAAARDEAAFHDLMRKVYGDGYDFEQAESLRRRALDGDFSWLPRVEYASDAELRGANGAYDAQNGVVYLNESKKDDTALLAATFAEEAGHHLDTLLSTGDTRGDEGELLRRLLSGENLTATDIATIRAENDHGVIIVDGKRIEVEFWLDELGEAVSGGFKAAGDAIDSVTKPVRDGAKAVGDAIHGAGHAAGSAINGAAKAADDWLGANFGPVGGAIGDVIRGGAGALVTFGRGIADVVVMPWVNLFEGRFADALEAPVRGLARIFVQSPERFLNGFFDGAETLTRAIPIPIVSEMLTRGVDILRTITTTGFGLAEDTLRFIPGLAINSFRHLETAAHRLFRGDLGGAGLSVLWSIATPFTDTAGYLANTTFRVLSAIGGIVGDLGFSPASRGLTDSEKNDLQAVFGESVDLDQIRLRVDDPSNQLGMAPHTVGNTIYMPSSVTTSDGTVIVLVNPDGSLTDDGKRVLAHEVGHVWQNQNGGGDYMGTAICAQCTAVVGSLAAGQDPSASAAYDWRAQAALGVPFDELTPEQQAELMEDASAAHLLGDGDGELEIDDFAFGKYVGAPITAEELAYMERALELVRRGDSTSIHGGLG